MATIEQLTETAEKVEDQPRPDRDYAQVSSGNFGVDRGSRHDEWRVYLKTNPDAFWPAAIHWRPPAIKPKKQWGWKTHQEFYHARGPGFRPGLGPCNCLLCRAEPTVVRDERWERYWTRIEALYWIENPIRPVPA